MAANEVQTSLPPAQPSYVFRGHAAHVHCVLFVRQNSRLLTGDADGWVVLWKLASKRPVAVWRAHDAAILGFAEWGAEKIITHGRDNALKVWQLRDADEPQFSTVLPADNAGAVRPQPWLLHSLGVNTLNFCAFSSCLELSKLQPAQDQASPGQSNTKDGCLTDSILVAVPGTEDKKVDIFQLPSEHRIHTVPRVISTDTGMVMAVKIVHHSSKQLLVITGYESGLTAVHQLEPSTPSSSKATWSTIFPTWHLIYLSKPHSQPVLSLDVTPDTSTYFTSSADAIVASHRIPTSVTLGKEQPKHPPFPSITPPTSAPPTNPQPSHQVQTARKLSNTKHAGQQSLRVRSDGRILATAGWDGRVRVYSAKSLKEVAVLKWHRDGTYAVAFAEIQPQSLHAPHAFAAEKYSSTISSPITEVNVGNPKPEGYNSPYASTSPTPTPANRTTSDRTETRTATTITSTTASTTPVSPSDPSPSPSPSYPIHLTPILTPLPPNASPTALATTASKPYGSKFSHTNAASNTYTYSKPMVHGVRDDGNEGVYRANPVVASNGYGGGGGGGAMRELEGRREEVETGRHWIAAGGKDGRVSLWVVY